MPGESKLSPRRIAAARRQSAALELRSEGYTFQAIADELGYATRDSAHKAVTAALDRTLIDTAENARTLELARLDRMWLGIHEKAFGGDLKAIHTALRIMERRAKLLGLDYRPGDDAEPHAVVIPADEDMRSEELDALIAEYQAKHPPR